MEDRSMLSINESAAALLAVSPEAADGLPLMRLAVSWERNHVARGTATAFSAAARLQNEFWIDVWSWRPADPKWLPGQHPVEIETLDAEGWLLDPGQEASTELVVSPTEDLERIAWPSAVTSGPQNSSSKGPLAEDRVAALWDFVRRASRSSAAEDALDFCEMKSGYLRRRSRDARPWPPFSWFSAASLLLGALLISSDARVVSDHVAKVVRYLINEAAAWPIPWGATTAVETFANEFLIGVDQE